MLSAINLGIEKVNKRQAEFEQSISRKLDTANKRMTNIELTLKTVLQRLDEARATSYRISEPEQTVSEESSQTFQSATALIWKNFENYRFRHRVRESLL